MEDMEDMEDGHDNHDMSRAAWLRLSWQVAHDMSRDGCRPADPWRQCQRGGLGSRCIANP